MSALTDAFDACTTTIAASSTQLTNMGRRLASLGGDPSAANATGRGNLVASEVAAVMANITAAVAAARTAAGA